MKHPQKIQIIKDFFSNLWNKIKSNQVIEEEDYIDAHGFPAKRPKKKIPLLKKKGCIKQRSQL